MMSRPPLPSDVTESEIEEPPVLPSGKRVNAPAKGPRKMKRPAGQGDRAPSSSALPQATMEIFAGSKRLTAAMMKNGYKVDTVEIMDGGDHNDMSLQATVMDIASRIKSKKYKYIHMAPPCSTFSNARHPKLRSKAEPNGKSDLSERDRTIVKYHNSLLNNTFKLANMCAENGVALSLENPNSSIMWHTRVFKVFEQTWNPRMIIMDYCSYGEKYKKRTKLMVWAPGDKKSFLDPLNKLCDGTHKHQQLSGWRNMNNNDNAIMVPTKGTPPYPLKLCTEWAELIKHL